MKFCFYMLIISPFGDRAVGVKAYGLLCRFISKAEWHYVHREVFYEFKSTALVFTVEFPYF